MTSKYGILTIYKEDALKKDLNLIKKGDILFFHRQSLNDNFPRENNKYPGHCGIYLGNQKFIHASKSKKKVIISNFSEDAYWLNILVGAKNIINDLIESRKINYKPISKGEIFKDAKSHLSQIVVEIDDAKINYWINMIKQHGIKTIIENGEENIIPIIEQIQFRRNGFEIDLENNIYIKKGFGAFIGNFKTSIKSFNDLNDYTSFHEHLNTILKKEGKLVIGPAAPNVYGLVSNCVGLYCLNYKEILEKLQFQKPHNK